jgi:hypothetical protein
MAENRINDKEVEHLLMCLGTIDDARKEIEKRSPPDKDTTDIGNASDGAYHVLNDVRGRKISN